MTNSQPQKQSDDMSYWMGQVDAKLSQVILNVDKIIAGMSEQSKEDNEWKTAVERRLEQGAAKFEEHDNMFADVVSQLAKFATDQKAAADFLSWSWIRDNTLIPMLRAIITILVAYIAAKAFGIVP